MGRFRVRCALAVWLGLLSALLTAGVTLAEPPANEHFQRTWARTDQPVAAGETGRTWMWGPEAFTSELIEPYQESPGGQRAVQYFDKSRMEITFPDEDSNSIWYVTNGLLVVELITGNMQTGHDSFEPRSPALVNVAGDPEGESGPTYATFAGVLDAEPAEPGQIYTQRLNRDGTVGNRLNLSRRNVAAAVIDEETQHTIAEPFWEFMNSSGLVLQDDVYTTAALFENPYFATGRPITEAYWASVRVAGELRDVLMQCFERRCLTYTPDNAPEWQVEAGNVGQHYHQWRYGDAPAPDPPTPDPPAPPPTDSETFSDGIWIVGQDIQPGIYRSSVITDSCYWARLSGLGGTIDDIITNGIAGPRMVVEIAPTDVAFESSGCGTWSDDLNPITSSPTEPFGDGTYLVTSEIASGTWRSSGSDESCYWERLSGFSGELHHIIANDFIPEEDAGQPQLVAVAPTDTGFLSQGCGTWTYLGS